MTNFRTFSFVGINENPSFSEELSQWLGKQLDFQIKNVTDNRFESLKSLLSTELSSAAIELTWARTRIDARLWSHIARCYFEIKIDDLREKAILKGIARFAEMMKYNS